MIKKISDEIGLEILDTKDSINICEFNMGYYIMKIRKNSFKLYNKKTKVETQNIIFYYDSDYINFEKLLKNNLIYIKIVDYLFTFIFNEFGEDNFTIYFNKYKNYYYKVSFKLNNKILFNLLTRDIFYDITETNLKISYSTIDISLNKKLYFDEIDFKYYYDNIISPLIKARIDVINITKQLNTKLQETKELVENNSFKRQLKINQIMNNI